jgi:uncharacterized membrane protein YphA (DoxX/SURF4 family)
MNRLPPNAAFWLTVGRVYLGAYWLIHGLAKLLNHAQLTIPPWYHGMLAGSLAQNMRYAEPAVAIAESVVGLLLILGLFTRLSAFAALALGAGFFLTKGAYMDYAAFAGSAAAITVLAVITFALSPGAGLDGLGAYARARSARRVERVRATPVNVQWPE